MADSRTIGSDEIGKVEFNSLLFDFYGQLLPAKQRTVMELYHEDDLSLSEIAEDLSTSRQTVHYTLKQAEKKLVSFEEALGLVERFSRNKREAARASKIAESLRTSVSGDSDAQKRLSELEKIISFLGE